MRDKTSSNAHVLLNQHLVAEQVAVWNSFNIEFIVRGRDYRAGHAKMFSEVATTFSGNLLTFYRFICCEMG